MTTPINDGGPAFPAPEHGGSWQDENGVRVFQYCAMPGMSLRDWFAGQALAGDLAAYSTEQDSNYRFKAVAERCYGYADAMLAARARQ